MNQSAAKSPFREDHKVSDKSPVHLDVETGRNFLRPFPWLLVSRWMLSPVSSISERSVRKGWRAPIRKARRDCCVTAMLLSQQDQVWGIEWALRVGENVSRMKGLPHPTDQNSFSRLQVDTAHFHRMQLKQCLAGRV